MRLLCLVLTVTASAFAAAKPQVTFYRDVLPILQKNCQGCHRAAEYWFARIDPVAGGCGRVGR